MERDRTVRRAEASQEHLLLAAFSVMQTLVDNGYQAFLVGGAVRDRMLNRPIKDVDVATNARPEQVIGLFPKVVPTGIRHGTVTVLFPDATIEVTTFRQEGVYEDFRHPSQVWYVDDIRLDLARRDFTINAIAEGFNGQYIDPFHGIQDLGNALVRAVGNSRDRLTEDALRVLRGIRFAVQLDFKVEEITWDAICEKRVLLANIARERIRDEWSKIAQADLERGLRLLFDSLVIQEIWPDVRSEKLLTEPWNLLPASLPLRTAALLLKMELTQDEVAASLRRLRYSKAFSQQVRALMDAVHRVPDLEGSSKYEWRTFLFQYGPLVVLDACRLTCFFKRMPECLPLERAKYWIETQPLWNPRELKINGHDLAASFPGRDQGPWLREALNLLIEAVLREEVSNDKSLLLRYWEGVNHGVQNQKTDS